MRKQRKNKLFSKAKVVSFALTLSAGVVSSLSLAQADNARYPHPHHTPHTHHGDGGGGHEITTIHEAMHLTMETNPEILFQVAEREATRQKITQEFGAYLPVIDLRAGAGREYVHQDFKVNRLTSTPTNASVTTTRYDPSITLTQKIFDGLETPHRVEKAELELVQSTRNIEEARLIVAFAALDKYIAVRRFERLLKLARENVVTHQRILSKIRQLVKAGKATAADEHNVLSRLHDAQAAVGDIEGDLETAKANFKETVGADAGDLKIPHLDEAHIPGSVEEAVNMAIRNNRSVHVAEATVDVAKADFDVTMAPFMPSIEFQLQAKRDFNVGGKNGIENNVIGQFIGNFNVFNGYRDIGRRRELRHKITAAQYRKQQEMRRAEKEVRVSYAEMLSARGQAKALRKAVKSKKRINNIYMTQFAAGKRSFLDILDSSHEYFLAKGSLITADASEDLAAGRVLAAIGTLLEMYSASGYGDYHNAMNPIDITNHVHHVSHQNASHGHMAQRDYQNLPARYRYKAPKHSLPDLRRSDHGLYNGQRSAPVMNGQHDGYYASRVPTPESQRRLATQHRGHDHHHPQHARQAYPPRYPDQNYRY